MQQNQTNGATKYILVISEIFLFADCLRRLFCLLSMQEMNGEPSLMERLILSDTQLWKGQ
jgi:hypothetical protein